MLFDQTMKSIRNFVPMESEDQIADSKAREGSSKEGDARYYETHMADGSYKTYIFFSDMLNDFDREDLIVLYKLFNKKYASTRPDNATKDEDPKYRSACCRITRRGNGLVEVEGVEDLGMVGNQGNVRNQDGNVVNENVQENVRNVLVNGNQEGYSYKEFLACNSKEYDAKRGAIVLTRWIKNMENVQDMSGCSMDQKVKYIVGSFVGKALTAGHASYTDRFHELARLVPLLVTPESRMIERNGLIKKVEKRGNVGEPSKAKSGKDDNKRTKTGNVFATTMNPVGKENTSTWPKCTIFNSNHEPEGLCRTCFNCNRLGHLEKYYRGVPRNVNPVNARNPPVRGRGIQENQARDRAFMLGAKEARIEPSELGFRFETKIASGQLVEIDKVIKGCKLEIEGYVFDINLIPFGHGSFDMIIGNFMPPTPDLSFTGLDEFANKPVAENSSKV
nr:hypothetical protein [Tanacetum cinerariifolium]